MFDAALFVCHNLAASTEAFRRMKRLLSIVILQAALLGGAIPALAAAACGHAGMGEHSCCRRAMRAAGDTGAMPRMHCASHQAHGETSVAGQQLALVAAEQRCPCLNNQAPSAPAPSVSVPAPVRHDAGQAPTYALSFVLGDAPATLLVNARQNAPPVAPASLFVVNQVFRL